MSTTSALGSSLRKISSETIVSGLFLVIFIMGWITANNWPGQHAALFPRGICVLGSALSAVLFVSSLRPTKAVEEEGEPTGPPEGDVTAAHVDLGDLDDSDESALAATGYSVQAELLSATKAQWIEAVSWAAVFFLGVWLFGLYPVTFVFTALYVRIVGGVKVVYCVLYAVILVAVLYVSFNIALSVLVPEGILLT